MVPSATLFAVLLFALIPASLAGRLALAEVSHPRPVSVLAATVGASLTNKPAPAFSLAALDGRPLTLAHLRGKVILLNFWATWCAPCQIEMPTFSAWQTQYGRQGLQVIGISMDDDPALARRAVERLRVSYPVAMGNARLGARYGGVLGLPLTFLIDRQGIVRASFQGETDLHAIEKQIQSLLTQRR